MFLRISLKTSSPKISLCAKLLELQTAERIFHKRPNKSATNDRTKSQQTTEKVSKDLYIGGEKLINDGAKALKTLAETIDTTKMKNPSFMMVVTAVGPYAYQRPDGVFVVPIGCLKD